MIVLQEINVMIISHRVETYDGSVWVVHGDQQIIVDHGVPHQADHTHQGQRHEEMNVQTDPILSKQVPVEMETMHDGSLENTHHFVWCGHPTHFRVGITFCEMQTMTVSPNEIIINTSIPCRCRQKAGFAGSCKPATPTRRREPVSPMTSPWAIEE